MLNVLLPFFDFFLSFLFLSFRKSCRWLRRIGHFLFAGFNCKQYGHRSRDCPEPPDEARILLEEIYRQVKMYQGRPQVRIKLVIACYSLL